MCGTLHDALIVEATEAEIDRVVAQTEEVMRKASQGILGGFELRTEAKVVKYPERYRDKRGKRTLDIVEEELAREDLANPTQEKVA